MRALPKDELFFENDTGVFAIHRFYKLRPMKTEVEVGIIEPD